MSKQLKKIAKICKKGINFIYSYTKIKPLKFFEATDFNESRLSDIFVVAFNDAKLIETQYNFMQKNLQSNQYHYVICDNSNNIETADKIFKFCKNNNITYHRLPHFLYVGPSNSHGYALNWIYKNIITKRKNNFAFIDHDIFPIKPVDLSFYFSYPLCGAIRERKNYWYPWAAFSFYNYDFMKSKKVNFLPCRYKHQLLDTGGGNYLTIYKNIDKNSYHTLKEQFINVHTEEIVEYESEKYKDLDEFIYNNAIETIDDKWLHIIGGAQYSGKHNKFELAVKMVETLSTR